MIFAFKPRSKQLPRLIRILERYSIMASASPLSLISPFDYNMAGGPRPWLMINRRVVSNAAETVFVLS